MPGKVWCAALVMAACLNCNAAASQICVTDDADATLCLDDPVKRIATLSPGATELVWAAGAGDSVVAVVDFSDYPPQAKRLPSVGSHTRIDMERLLTLAPDLAVVWVSGNPAAQIAALEDLRIPVFAIEPRTIDGVASVVQRLGRLAGTEAAAQAVSDRFLEGMTALDNRFRQREPVTVFYQIWDNPLMTISDEHLIGQVISLCGGRNSFGQLNDLVPRINAEAVLARNPDAILAGGMGEANDTWLTAWQRYPGLRAVQLGNLFFIPPSLIQRPTPRLLQGATRFCDALDTARRRISG